MRLEMPQEHENFIINRFLNFLKDFSCVSIMKYNVSNRRYNRNKKINDQSSKREISIGNIDIATTSTLKKK